MPYYLLLNCSAWLQTEPAISWTRGDAWRTTGRGGFALYIIITKFYHQ